MLDNKSELQKKPSVTARFAITDGEQKPVKASVVLNGEDPEYTFEEHPILLLSHRFQR